MSIKGLYQRIKKQRQSKRIAPYVDLSPDSHYGNDFRVDLRSPETNRKYLRIGSHCLIDGTFIFEREHGCVVVGDRVHIGESTFICTTNINIGDDVTIAWGCLFYDHNSHSVLWDERKNDTEQEYQDISNGLSPIANKNWDVVKSAPITICSKAWIGVGVKVLKGVTIGEGAVVGAGSVVTKDVPAWCVVAGNPAQVVKRSDG